MSESRMWKALRPVLKPVDPVRIESRETDSGIPDVNYTQGWIELKYMPKWPVRGGALRIDHYTREQKAWGVRRHKAGGKVFLLLKVGRLEWLLFDAITAAKHVGKTPKERLYKVCLARWTRLPRTEEILIWLQ